jgi:hypothetical protein
MALRSQETSNRPPPAPRSGLLVSRGAGGSELVAFFSPRSFTSFTDARELAALKGRLFVATAAQPDVAGGPTAHVQLQGLVDPSVSRVEIALAEGGTIRGELVRVGGGKHSFFTYETDDPAKFPTIVRAFSSSGAEVGSSDVTSATRPPAYQG